MTLYISFILHIYQPPTQQPSMLKKIIKESYLPLFGFLIKNPKIKMTFNINGSLLELFEFFQEKDLIEKIKTLIYRDQIDLLGSSCYHAILPLIPTEEIIRQIELNEEIHQRVLGEKMIKSKGFWLPEMAYDSRVVESLLKKNYSWTAISSVATPEKQLPDNYIPILNSDFTVFFRNDLLSNYISFNQPTVDDFYQAVKGDKNQAKDDYYVILAMDGETYGHHIKNLIEDFLEPFLNKIINDINMRLVKVAELP